MPLEKPTRIRASFRHPDAQLTPALRRVGDYTNARRAMVDGEYTLAQTLLRSLLRRPWITDADRRFIDRQLHIIRASNLKKVTL